MFFLYLINEQVQRTRNLLGVLKWDLQETQQSAIFESLFELE